VSAPTAETATGTVEVFFDFTCEFSNRARHWLDGLEGLEVRWRPFSLLEVNRRDGGGVVFARPEHADNVSLVALAVFEAVTAAGANAEQYRHQMFSAWHDEHDRYGRLSPAQIAGFGQTAGLYAFDRDAAFARLAAEHAAGAALGVFGTPTFVFGPDQAAFVKLDRVPAPEEAAELWESVRRLAVAQPALREWQRPARPEMP
jgi:2-hydroxychromene-2-carboxylate isomerase